MSDSIVWITGASRGLGRALAETVPFPAHVVDVSRSGGDAADEHFAADLSDPAVWAALTAHLRERLTGGDVGRALFVNNAGVLDPIGPAGEVDTAAYARMVLVDAAAPLALGQAFLAAVADFDGAADLVGITSGFATKPGPGLSGYCAAKAGLEHWTRTVGEEQRRRAERGRRACRVLAVAPGVVDTAMHDATTATDTERLPSSERFRAMRAAGEMTTPEDAARGIWALLERGDAETGAVIDLRDLAA